MCPVCLQVALLIVLQIINICSPHLKILKHNFNLEKPSLIPTLHGAQVNVYHFYQKQLMNRTSL